MNWRLIFFIVGIICLIALIDHVHYHTLEQHNLEEVGDTIQLIESR